MEFIKLLLSGIALAPFIEKVTDPNFIFLGVAILLCGFIAHGNGK